MENNNVVGLYTNPSMIIAKSDCADAKEVIEQLCGRAQVNHCVDDTFVTALLEREKEFPTGLPTIIPIAIPHVHDGCQRSFFSMAVLNKEVTFQCMGDPDEEIKTKLVFLFGITDPSYQTEVLKKFSTMFQNKELLESLLVEKNEEKLIQIMQNVLGEYIVLDENK